VNGARQVNASGARQVNENGARQVNVSGASHGRETSYAEGTFLLSQNVVGTFYAEETCGVKASGDPGMLVGVPSFLEIILLCGMDLAS